ncbi:Glutathione S-transferase GstB [Rubrobacter xylanophilus DSM 9941]|uniref:glutathione S-transferase family protein n=1 Tax=Rubrobacter xylanophilus TaxID=49319 RepID=UPI001C63F331|nr:glutathione S-transferase family protein [Rubrobacter xylanophilus]QYJ16463.1 Glutathione S-transferase GstB [Rubrobacter xylanophilus DSM 9941]
MLKVWGRNNSINVQKVLWCCRELGIEYERVDAGGAHGFPEGYERINPNRLVPTIEEDGFVLWESNAIVRYLAARYGAGTLWPEDPRARASADRWMDWQATVLWTHLRPVFWGLVRTPPEERDAAAIEEARKKTAGAWAILERHLEGRRYVEGEALTVADIPLGVSARRWFGLDIERPSMPNLEAWYGRLLEREAFRDCVAGIPLT